MFVRNFQDNGISWYFYEYIDILTSVETTSLQNLSFPDNISGCYSGEYEDDCILECCVVYSDRGSPTFQRRLLCSHFRRISNQLPWRCRQQAPPKYTFSGLQCHTSQKTAMVSFSAIRLLSLVLSCSSHFLNIRNTNLLWAKCKQLTNEEFVFRLATKKNGSLIHHLT